MRIQSGIHKGRSIHPKVTSKTRPTTARVRKAIFDTLFGKFDLNGALVLDLFAGTGSLGFEAGSRGASAVTFVEYDHSSVLGLNRSVAAIAKDGGTRYKVVQRDVFSYLAGAPESADICFCDPPYRFDEWERLLTMVPAGYLVAESNREIGGSQLWTQTTLKVYGDTVVSFLSRNNDVMQPFSREDES